MKRIVTLLIIKILLVPQIFAQQNIREQVYVHLNRQTFLSGETMYISAYCNSRLTGQPSPMSKILYVEIVGKDGPVHQQKISLDEGRGSSEFFISSSIPSGQYYLLAYTRWMKNFEDYFQSPVLIINPFESYPEEEVVQNAEVELFPLHDPLIAGLENVVAMKLATDNPSDFKGRLVNSSGELVLNFAVDAFGLAKVKFTPQKGQAYQVILEDSEGRFNIYDLPAVGEKGSMVTYQEKDGSLSLRYQEAGNNTDVLKLVLFSDGILLHQAEVVPDEYYKVPGVLSDGIYHAQYTDESGRLLAKRSVMLSNAKPKKTKVSKTYGQRQKVEIDPELEPGNYSVSVRKSIDPEFELKRHAIWNSASNALLQSPVLPSEYLSANGIDTEAFMLASVSQLGKINPEQVSLLPELREELLVGNITDGEGKPAADQKIALSFPGNPFQLRIGESSENGDFIIPFQSSVSDTEAILTALDFNKEFKIHIKSPFLEKYPDFNYSLPQLDSNVVAELIAKSIRVQIENAYFDFSEKKSRSNQWLSVIPFHETYFLDDYKRFSTLKETITEFVITANVRENREHVIKTSYFPGLGQPEYPPLVLLDGVPVSGEKVIQLNPYKVRSISVLPNRYFLGPSVMDGIVGLETFGKDLGDFRLDLEGSHKKIPVVGVAEPESYHFRDYSENANHHLADQRDQLYWNQAFSPSQEDSKISFYTSDVAGKYEIVIEGFTNEGKPVSKVYTFMVEPDKVDF